MQVSGVIIYFLLPEVHMNYLAGYSFVYGADVCLRKDLLRQPETIYKASP